MIPDQNSTPTILGSLQIHKHVLVEQFCTYDIISSDCALEETEDTFFFSTLWMKKTSFVNQ